MDLHKTMRARAAARQPKLAEGANASNWYEIRNQGGRATVRIYQEIGYWGVTAEDFAAELSALTASEIEVQINSPGGDVFDGIAIYNALRAHPARVVTRVDGLAASAASVIVQAGDHRVILSSAQIMIHEAWGVAVGPAAEIRDFADLLDKQNDVLAKIYADRAGGAADHFRQLMAAETWLTDQEAIAAGLADEVFTPDRQDAPTTAASEVDIRALIADELAKREPVVEPPPASAGVNQDAARSLLAAFTTEGNPHE